MRRQFSCFELVVGALLLLAASGCAAFRNTSDVRVYRAELADGRTVEVHCYSQHTTFGGPSDNFVQASWSICPKAEHEQGKHATIARRSEAHGKPPELVLGQLEARTAEHGRYIWLIDVDAQRVIAALDSHTGATTAMDDPAPPWATLAGGTPARQIPEKRE